MRIFFTRLFALIPLALLVCGKSHWTGNSPAIAAFLFVSGTIAIGVAILGRLWCSLYIAGRKDRVLVVNGPYSLSRNPLYLFSFFGAVGIGLATQTFTIPLILTAAFMIYYPQIISREETKLSLLFPKEFPAYKASVPRFFPHHLRPLEVDDYAVNPKIFRRHMGSAVWFIWILGLLKIVELLHSYRLLPIFFSLY